MTSFFSLVCSIEQMQKCILSWVRGKNYYKAKKKKPKPFDQLQNANELRAFFGWILLMAWQLHRVFQIYNDTSSKRNIYIYPSQTEKINDCAIRSEILFVAAAAAAQRTCVLRFVQHRVALNIELCVRATLISVCLHFLLRYFFFLHFSLLLYYFITCICVCCNRFVAIR